MLAAIPHVAVLAIFFAVAAPSAGAPPKGIPRDPGLSSWVDAQHGWTWHDESVYATRDGGRTWRRILAGSNHLFNPGLLRASRNAGVVATGKQDGTVLWTNDGGRHWYDMGGLLPLGTEAVARGSQFFWHPWQGRRGTLYRVESWPPRGEIPCKQVIPDWGVRQPRGHFVCTAPPDDAGMRSVVVAQLEQGSFRVMRVVPGGVVALVSEPNDRHPQLGASQAAVYRAGSLSLTPLPEPALVSPEDVAGIGLAAAGPRVYATAALTRPHPPRRDDTIGSVLWRSGDGGRAWTVWVARRLPQRVPLLRVRPRIGRRAWLPGGIVASARVAGRPALVIRQGTTERSLALPHAGKCSVLEPHVDWPHIFVQGRRGGRTTAVWWSGDGGKKWTRFGGC